MTILQSTALASSTVKVRWQEPYISAGLNQKAMAAYPKGVVAGFTVVPNGGLTVAVQTDAALGVGLANIWDTTAGTYVVTVAQPTAVILNLTPQANTTVFIVLDAQYSVGSASSASISVVDDLTTNPDWIVLAKVSVPGTTILTSHINTGYRQDSGDRIPDRAFRATNLVNNPGFESGTTAGWYSDGTFTTFAATNALSYNGNWCLELSRLVVGTSIATSAPMPVSMDLKYRVSGRFRTIAGLSGGNGAKFQIGWFNAADAQVGGWEDIETAIVAATVSPPFAERRAEVTAPTLATRARLRMVFDGCSGTLFVDDVEFSTPTPLLQQTAVFGGALSVADAFHMHTAAGQAYAGNTGPAPANWALAAGNIEGALDQIGNDLSGSAGATKVGFVATTPVDLPVSPVTVTSALDTLDDLKAGINIANTFTKNNTFTSSVTNTSALTATGNGAGAGLSALGGGTNPTTYATRAQGAGVVSVGGTGLANGVVARGGESLLEGVRTEVFRNIGVLGVGSGAFGAGAGAGVVGVSAASGSAAGVEGYGSTGAHTVGVRGTGSGLGVGGYFTGGTSGGNGVSGYGSSVGNGLYGESSGSGHGVNGTATGAGHGVNGTSTGSGHGVRGSVGSATSYGVFAENTNATGIALRAESLSGGTAIYAAATLGIDVNAGASFGVRAYNESGSATFDGVNGDGGPALTLSGSNGYASSVARIANSGGSTNPAYAALEVVGLDAKGVTVSTTGGAHTLSLDQSGTGRALDILKSSLGTAHAVNIDVSGTTGSGMYLYHDTGPTLTVDADGSLGAKIKHYSNGLPLSVESVGTGYRVIEVIGPVIPINTAAHNSINRANLVRAWVNLNSLGTPALSSGVSFSVASVTATAGGRLTVTFTAGTMPSANYVPVVVFTKTGSSLYAPYYITIGLQTAASWAVDVRDANNGGALLDLSNAGAGAVLGIAAAFIGVGS